jgi:hypothetical protein
MNRCVETGSGVDMPTVSALIGTRIGWGYTVYTLIAASVLGVLATLLIRPSLKIS